MKPYTRDLFPLLQNTLNDSRVVVLTGDAAGRQDNHTALAAGQHFLSQQSLPGPGTPGCEGSFPGTEL